MRRSTVALLVVIVATAVGALSGASPKGVRAATALTSMTFPWALTAGPDGAVWFTYNNAGPPSDWAAGVGRLTVSGALQQFPQKSNHLKEGIATGADGALWFSSDTGITRMTTSGVMQTFRAGSPARGVIRGADGDVWFTGESTTGGVATVTRITHSGSMTAYKVPPSPYNPRPEPDALTTSSGLTWFGDRTDVPVPGPPVIGRVDSKGIVETNATPIPDPAGTGIRAVAGGSGGRVWYVTVGVIGYLGSTGSTGATSVPGDHRALAAGPDGRLWFDCLNDGPGTMCAYAPQTGTVTRYRYAPGFAAVGQIISGPGGLLWFTAPDDDAIFSLSTSGTFRKFELPEPPPAVNSLNPGGGTSAGGRTLTLYGQFLGRTTSVVVGGVAAAIVNKDAYLVEVTTPASATDRVVDVSITTPTGTATLAHAYTYQTPPLVTGVSPSQGVTGTQVTITGTHLDASTCVIFFSEQSACAVPTVVSSTELQVTAPSNQWRTCSPDSGCGPVKTFVGTSDVVVGKQFVSGSANPPADDFTYTS